MNTKKRRHREPVVGMWLHIQDRHDKGGAPLIRVERIEPSGWVYVTDWLSFEREAPRTQMPGGYTPPRERCFAFDADEFSRRSLRYWRRVQPARRLLGPNFNYLQANCIMVLAAERMGHTMSNSSLATRHLKGEPLHPTLAAGIEAEATIFHNQIRSDAALVTQANKHAEAIKVEFGFQSAPHVAPSPQAARPRSMRP